MKLLSKFTLVAIILLAIGACTKSGSSDQDGNSGTTAPASGEPEARTDCGVVINNSLINPIKNSDGEAVRIEQVAASDAFIVATKNGKILVKIQGIAGSSDSSQAAIDYLGRYNGKTVLFIKASSNCSALVSGGGSAQVGQLITSAGESISETLIRAGLAQVDEADGCGSELLSGCLKALSDSDPITAGPLNAFLWKPQSDSDGKLAVHTGPFGTTVTVNGEVGRNQGGGNGFGSLARFKKSGCAYSKPAITVRSSSGLAYTVNGQATFSVPNPCGRYCLRDGSIVACPK